MPSNLKCESETLDVGAGVELAGRKKARRGINGGASGLRRGSTARDRRLFVGEVETAAVGEPRATEILPKVSQWLIKNKTQRYEPCAI